LLFPILETDGVDHALALHSLQTSLKHIPATGINHHRDPGNFGITGQNIQEPAHGIDGIEHGIVHIHIDDLSTTTHLAAAHFKGLFQLVFLNQTSKFSAASHVGSLAHIHEQTVVGDVQGFQSCQPGSGSTFFKSSGLDACEGRADSLDEIGCGATTTAGNIQQSAGGKIGQNGGHLVGGFIVPSQLIGQPGIGVN